jgi:hypothetical protein
MRVEIPRISLFSVSLDKKYFTLIRVAKHRGWWQVGRLVTVRVETRNAARVSINHVVEFVYDGHMIAVGRDVRGRLFFGKTT